MTAPRHRRATRRAVLAACAAAVTALSCAEFGTGIGDISYIAFDGIPWPSLVAGDTMRDSLGTATPLRASAFDASGHAVPDAAFTFLALDTGVAVDADGYLRATTRRGGTVRLVASLRGLQTGDEVVRVTRRPDSVFARTPATVSLAYVIPDAGTNVAPEMAIRLVSGDSLDVGPAVPGWLVRWRVVHAGDTLARTDTALVALQTTAGARSATDTTSDEGTSARRLRVFAERLVAARDSFVVLADVRRYGTPVPGSPVRFVVNVAPPGAP